MKIRANKYIISFTGVWVCLAAGTIYMHLHEEESSWISTDTPIANLDESKGLIEFRRKDVPLWFKARNQQSFENGDRISTGKEARAEIVMEDGRVLKLGQDTLITLKVEKNSSSLNQGFTLTLNKGTLEVAAASKDTSTEGRRKEKRPESTSTITIISGSQAIKLGSDTSAVTLTKRANEEAKVESKTGTVAFEHRVDPAQHEEPLTFSDEKREMQGALDVRAYSPVVSPFARKATLWTTMPLNDENLSLHIQVRPAELIPNSLNWKPFVSVSDQKDSHLIEGVFAQGRGAMRAQDLLIPISKMKSVGLEAGAVAKRELRLVLRAGAQVTNGNEQKSIYANDEIEIRLRSLVDVAGGVSISWEQAAEMSLSGPFFPERRLLGGKKFYAKNPFALSMLLNLVTKDWRSGVTNIELEPSVGLSEKDAIHFVKGATILASLNRAASKKIRNMEVLLGGSGPDLAFQGPASALLFEAALPSDSNPWSSGKIFSGRDVYLYTRAYSRTFKVFPANLGFIRREAAARRYLAGTHALVFSQPVELLFTKEVKNIAH